MTYSLCHCAFCDWIVISCETEWSAHSRVERMGRYQSYFTISQQLMTWATNNSINCYHSSDLSVKTHSRWKTCPMQFLNGLICWYVKQISSLAGAKDSHRFSSCEQINSNAKQSQLQHGHQVCLQTNGLQSEMWGRLKKKKGESILYFIKTSCLLPWTLPLL